MTWTLRDVERDLITAHEIDQQPDRGAAIIAGAFLEDRLTLCLKSIMVTDIKITNSFFTGMGPIATFSAKIYLAYLLGLYPNDMRTRLHIIRRIRNEFAHNRGPLKFSSQKITDLCKNLFHIAVLSSLKAELDEGYKNDQETLDTNEKWIGPLLNVPDTPRNAYINTIKMSMLLLEIMSQVKSNKGAVVSVKTSLPTSY